VRRLEFLGTYPTGLGIFKTALKTSDIFFRLANEEEVCAIREAIENNTHEFEFTGKDRALEILKNHSSLQESGTKENPTKKRKVDTISPSLVGQ